MTLIKKSLLKYLVYFLFYPFITLFILWNVCFGFIIGYVLLIVLVTSILLLQKMSIRNMFVIWGFSIIGYIVILPLTLMQYQKKSKMIYQKIGNGKELLINEKIGIYGLNLIIGILGFPIYSQAAKETLYLCIPTKEGRRLFYSDFFLKSQKIQNAIRTNEHKITWSTNEYIFGKTESRFALALNPCYLDVKSRGDSVEYQIQGYVCYPRKCEVTLIKWPFSISIEEGLFWYLQKISWLHPYKTIWKCKKLKIK